jgi:hypothetical protein
MPNHTWIESDDLMILFIYKFGVGNSPLSKQEIADKIGVSLGSVSYRVGNFKAIDGVGNVTHFARLSEEVHKKYSGLNMQALKNIAYN